MELNKDQRKKVSGFTLMEMIIVLALFATLMMGIFGMLFSVYRFTNSTEYTISYKTQEDRVRNFISNIIRQNQVAGAIEVYGPSGARDHMSVKLADEPGKYAQFLMQDKMLYMYVGNEAHKDILTPDEVENKAVPLARDMKSIRFELTDNSDTGQRLLHIEQISERMVFDFGAHGMVDKTNKFDYKINIYTR